MGHLATWGDILIVTAEKEEATGIYRGKASSVEISSAAQLRLTLCDPMDCSTPGLPVHHQLPEVFRSGMLLKVLKCTGRPPSPSQKINTETQISLTQRWRKPGLKKRVYFLVLGTHHESGMTLGFFI